MLLHLRLRSLAFCSLVAVVAAFGCETTSVREHDEFSITEKSTSSFLDGELSRLEKLAEEFPKRHDLQYRIAGVHFERGELKESLTRLQKAIALDEESAESKYHYHLGRVYLLMGEKKLAETAFLRAVELTKGGRYSGPHAALGFVHALQRELPAAETEFRRCIEIEPENTEFYYFLGAVCDMQGKANDAIQNFREYLDRGGRRYRKNAVFFLERLGVEVEQAVGGAAERAG